MSCTMVTSYYQRPPAKVPPPKTVERCEQAAINPASLTLHDPYGKYDDFFKAHTRLTIEELVQKAARTDDLSRLETDIIVWGPANQMDDCGPDMIDAMNVIRWR
ncbi:unnamed protein product [Aspergillus oryzae]|nr:unnamed protein product [Aspergillus oryzae]GMF84045.1 unnamed protein product [Aspergillus oryzae]